MRSNQFPQPATRNPQVLARYTPKPFAPPTTCHATPCAYDLLRMRLSRTPATCPEKNSTRAARTITFVPMQRSRETVRVFIVRSTSRMCLESSRQAPIVLQRKPQDRPSRSREHTPSVSHVHFVRFVQRVLGFPETSCRGDCGPTNRPSRVDQVEHLRFESPQAFVR